ncbi:MAG: glycosyltransferase family 4 protein [Geobacteraceae bacterium]|nr:glycosyltransferase family 4 protein [Geobacteraceae bacterium]
MKIVFLAPFGLRPKGTVIARMVPLAAELAILGCEVIIIAPPYTNPEDAGTIETVRGITVKNIRLGPFTGAAAAPFLSWRLFRAALAEKPVLIHLFKPKGYGGLAAMLQVVCDRLGMTMPHLFIDTDDLEGSGGMNEIRNYSPAEKALFAFQEQWLPPRATGVTAASRALAMMLQERGLCQNRLLYLPNCVDNLPPGNGTAVRERLGIDHDAPVLLLYTRFFEFSQEKLHRILGEVCEQVPAVRILVVGQGRQGEDELLRQAAHQGGFSANLVIAGWVEPEHLPDYLAVANVALYPFSDTPVNRAKCPAKLTELLRAGIPVVADHVGQIPEYLAPAMHSLLCSSDNPDEMATKCAALLLDPERRREASSALQSYIMLNYNWRRYAEMLYEFYRHCITAA